jgi:hypothetical protein
VDCLWGRSINRSLEVLGEGQLGNDLLPAIRRLRRFQKGRFYCATIGGGLTLASLIGIRYFKYDLCFYKHRQLRYRMPASLLLLPFGLLPCGLSALAQLETLRDLAALLAIQCARENFQGKTWEVLRREGHRFRSLDVQRLAGCKADAWSDADLERILRETPHLSLLAINGSALTVEGIQAIGTLCPSLDGLRLWGESSLEETALSDLGDQRLKGLTELTIASAPHLSTTALRGLCGSHRWRVLRLKKCAVGKGAASALADQRLLRELELGSPDLDVEEFSALAKLPKLQKMVFDCGGVDTAVVERLQTQLNQGRRGWKVRRVGKKYWCEDRIPESYSRGAGGAPSGGSGGWSVGFSARL